MGGQVSRLATFKRAPTRHARLSRLCQDECFWRCFSSRRVAVRIGPSRIIRVRKGPEASTLQVLDGIVRCRLAKAGPCAPSNARSARRSSTYLLSSAEGEAHTAHAHAHAAQPAKDKLHFCHI